MQGIVATLSHREAIEVRRKRLGWTQNDLSAAAGYGLTYGSHVQRGEAESPQALDKMDAALTAAEAASTRPAASAAGV